MQIIFNSLYRMIKNGQQVVNPAPVDKDTPDALWLSDLASALAKHLAGVGFTAWLYPPLTMAQGGSASNSDGYGKQYDLNIGQWHPTRWGRATQVLSANQHLHAAGLLVLEDAVIHQYDGGINQNYIEIGSDGKPDPTLFPKFPSCFVPTAAVDPVFDPQGNNADGDMVSYVNSTPKGYMLKGMLESLQWRTDALVLDGRRLDEGKGEAISTAKAVLALGGTNFAEVFTGGAELDRYVDETGATVLDFDFHFAAKAVCEGGSFWSWRYAGLWARRPNNAYLFADTGDTDGNNGENIRWNKLWAYAVGLMMPAKGMLIYSADYLPERYNLGKWIDNLCWISQTFAYGNLEYLYTDNSLLIFSRDGDGGSYGWSGGLTVVINGDPIQARGQWVKVPQSPGTRLHNYAPTFGPDTYVNNDGWAYLQAGPNVNGSAQSYSMWAAAGVEYTIPTPPKPHHVKHGLTDFTSITPFIRAKA